MTRIAIRSHVYRNNIPYEKRTRADFLFQTPLRSFQDCRTGEQGGIYTVKEAMERFNLSRDTVHGVLQFRQIPREKNGHFVRFLKVEFDHVMGVKK